MATHQVLIAGQWRDSDATQTFQASDPRAATLIPEDYPVRSWAECEAALDAGGHPGHQHPVAEALPALLRVVDRDDRPPALRRAGRVEHLPLREHHYYFGSTPER